MRDIIAEAIRQGDDTDPSCGRGLCVIDRLPANVEAERQSHFNFRFFVVCRRQPIEHAGASLPYHEF
jgi:hypothetical protein